MKTIIIYYSHSGNNTCLAEYLQKKLGCDIEEILETKKRSDFGTMLDILFRRSPSIKLSRARVENYDLVILVAPVWNARVAAPMRSFLRREQKNLNAFAFITVCGGRAEQRGRLFSEISELCQHVPLSVEELAVKDLVVADHSGKMGNVSTYRIKERDMKFFEPGITRFLNAAGAVDKYELAEKA